MTVGSMPDDTLWAAVQSGQFATVDDYKREAARLLAMPAARPSTFVRSSTNGSVRID